MCWDQKMALPELDRLVSTDRLKHEPPSQGEFDGLVKLGDAKLPLRLAAGQRAVGGDASSE